MNKKSVMIIAGEISGDLHAAALVRVLNQRNRGVAFFGIGGDELEQAGVEICRPARDMAVLGLSEVLQKYFFFKKVFRDMLALLRERRPDAVLLIDYPGFNLPFAAKAHALGIKVVYYICPQVWAWDRGRISTMAKTVDRLISIFPFEAEVFKNTGLRVDFVGHPLVTMTEAAREEPLSTLPWSGKVMGQLQGAGDRWPSRSAATVPWPSFDKLPAEMPARGAAGPPSLITEGLCREPHIAILPGSRLQEVKLILPAMVSAAGILKRVFPDAGFIIAAASREAGQWIEQVLSSMGMTGRFAIAVGRTRQILRQADAAWVASGTATIEAALMRCPMVVVYRVNPLTYLAGRMLIRVPFLGMVNIIAGRQICPELIQRAARPDKLAQAMKPILADGEIRNEMLGQLDRVRNILGSAGAEERAAEIVLQELS